MREPPTPRLVVFNALVLTALVFNDDELYAEELSALRLAFRGRRFTILITEGIIAEYQDYAGESFGIQLQPELDGHFRMRRAIYMPESRLSRFPIRMGRLPQEHRAFIFDAIAAGARYLITNRQRWLNLTRLTESTSRLSIVTPARFVELEG